jgi:succinyl-CoA synthetase beta subunit
MMASSEGGMDIEEVAEHHPKKLKKSTSIQRNWLGCLASSSISLRDWNGNPEVVNKAVKFFDGLV